MTPVSVGVFRGWWVVTGVFVMLLVTSGLGFYGLGVYLRALTLEQGFSVGTVSGATALFFAVTGVVGLPVAWLLARTDPRPIVAVGAVACGVALLLLGRVGAVWQVYGVYALFGAGYAAASLVPGTTLVTRWFRRRRSFALSIASTGLSAGGVAVTPFVAALVHDHGLAAVTPWLALAMVVGVVPVTSLLLRTSPAELGLRPDGDAAPVLRPDGDAAATPLAGSALRSAAPATTTAPATTAADGTPAAEAVSTRYFACVTGGHLLAMLAQVGGIAHLFNLVAERSGAGTAATALSLLAISSLAGRLLGGVVASRASLRAMAVVLMAVQAASLVLIAVAHGPTGLLVLTVLFGLTVGNLLMLHPLLLAERFGAQDYSAIYSRSALVATIGIAGGPALLGVLHDAVGGYRLAFSLAGLASLGAAAVLGASGPTRPVDRDRDRDRVLYGLSAGLRWGSRSDTGAVPQP